MDSSEESPWFIVNTKPRQEFIAERNLKSLGVAVYLPIYNKKVKKHKEKIEVTAPLFSGYLFSRFSITEFYHKVRYTKGVKSVLGNNQYLWTIAADRILDIQSREQEGVVILKRGGESFHRGDPILVDEGTFDGWEGIFYEELPDRERAIIMLTNVKFSNRLILPKKYLILDR